MQHRQPLASKQVIDPHVDDQLVFEPGGRTSIRKPNDVGLVVRADPNRMRPNAKLEETVLDPSPNPHPDPIQLRIRKRPIQLRHLETKRLVFYIDTSDIHGAAPSTGNPFDHLWSRPIDTHPCRSAPADARHPVDHDAGAKGNSAVNQLPRYATDRARQCLDLLSFHRQMPRPAPSVLSFLDMGAIVAIMGEAGDPELPERLDRMLARSLYRGAPHRMIENNLAIGIQTIGNDASLTRTERHIVAFHGFIGNWVEIARAHGLTFPTDSSHAERLAIAYEARAEKIAPDLRGEYSTLVFDRRHRTLTVIRDYFGFRPLFYECTRERRLFVGTEIRQVLAGSLRSPEINRTMMALRLVTRTMPPDRSLYEGVSRFVPGTIQRTTNENRQPDHPHPYWTPPPENPYTKADENELASELRETIVTAIRRTIPHDGEPYGLALSGGVDSSAIWGLLHHDLAEEGFDPTQCLAFSYSYPGEPCDETALIEVNLAAVNRAGNLLDVTEHPMSAGHQKVPAVPNAPFRTAFHEFDSLLKAASDKSAKTILWGYGGDEWLRGSLQYLVRLATSGNLSTAVVDTYRYVRAKRVTRMLWSQALRPWLGRTARELGVRRPQSHVPEWIHPDIRSNVASNLEAISECITGQAMSLSSPSVMSNVMLHQGGGLTDSIDQIGALHESSHRRPLMDLDVFALSCAIHDRWLMRAGRTKHLFRLAAAGAVPTSILDREAKANFTSRHIREGERLAEKGSSHNWILAREDVVLPAAVDRIITQAKMKGVSATIELTNMINCELFADRVQPGRN